MTKLQLSKLHATGNDFLVRVSLDAPSAALGTATAVALCDRHRGIGADGLITLGAGAGGAHCSMTLQNADGDVAEMSGNGVRCLAWVAAREGLVAGDQLVVDTGGGRRTIALHRNNRGEVVGAEVDMGAVSIDETDVAITVHGVEYRGDTAHVGNPHFVCFVDDPATVRVTSHGAIIERNERFPHGVNVEFARVDANDRVTMRVWERGVGETLSCGTGACATAAVAHARGHVGETVRVHVPGGELHIVLGATVRLGGPVVHVFDVDVEVA
jgi:diaminopimelate epimerase